MPSATVSVQIGGERPTWFTTMLDGLCQARWTIGLTAAMLLMNLSLFANGPAWATQLMTLLEYDRDAILHGQLWRLATGNLVHWSLEHFYLDVGAFLVLGLLYERSFKRPFVSFATFLLTVSLAIGAALCVLLPDMNIYRGLSGVDSGVFAAALIMEAAWARKDHRRWLFLAPAALIFTVKIAFECWTGELFFGTSSLGDLGQPVPLAHAAGALSALATIVVARR